MDRSTLEKKALTELKEIAGALELRGYQRMKKADIVAMIIDAGADGAGTDGAGVDDAGADDAGAPAAPPASARPAEAAPRVRNRDRADGRHGAPREQGTADAGPEVEVGDEDAGGRTRAKRERRRKGRPTGTDGSPAAGSQGPGAEDLDAAEVREGILDLLPEGYGFLRTTGYLAGTRDVYVSQSFVRRFDLRRGDRVAGPIRRNKNNDKFPALARVDAVEGEAAKPATADERRPEFKDLVAVHPRERLAVAHAADAPLAMRVADLVAPLGKGQRALVVAPPRSGKTAILKHYATAIEDLQPDGHVMVLLVDGRPEDVTDFERACRGEVVASPFDRPVEDHIQMAELALERAKRLVERGRDVVVLLDSLTALARAYQQTAATSGRVFDGGVDPAALQAPKRLLAAARNVDDGGSLTLVATMVTDHGSALDQAIFEGLEATAGSELRLDRGLADRRIHPAIDVLASGTRRDELLVESDEREVVTALRRSLAGEVDADELRALLNRIESSDDNGRFLAEEAASGNG